MDKNRQLMEAMVANYRGASSVKVQMQDTKELLQEIPEEQVKEAYRQARLGALWMPTWEEVSGQTPLQDSQDSLLLRSRAWHAKLPPPVANKQTPMA